VGLQHYQEVGRKSAEGSPADESAPDITFTATTSASGELLLGMPHKPAPSYLFLEQNTHTHTHTHTQNRHTNTRTDAALSDESMIHLPDAG
jgi:hypothetical protein